MESDASRRFDGDSEYRRLAPLHEPQSALRLKGSPPSSACKVVKSRDWIIVRVERELGVLHTYIGLIPTLNTKPGSSR